MQTQTHSEYVGDGHYVTIQYCEQCATYLGVNYPSELCAKCAKDRQQAVINKPQNKGATKK